MVAFKKTLNDLEEHAAAIAVRIAGSWHERAEAELGAPLPRELDLDSLPELIRTLARAAHAGPKDPASEELIRVAIKHGKDRRKAGYADTLIFREYHVLRRFLWDELRKSKETQDAVIKAILHIDAAMTAATAASALGFRLEDKPMDEETLIKRILKDWTMPGG
jgi:hypothetical protein